MSAIALRIPRKKDIACPRDGAPLRASPMGSAIVDVCGRCLGTFFDSGEMFAAAGVAADPSSWDRPESSGAVKASRLRCPRCEEVEMEAQDVTYDGAHVEIDRCGKCRGIWLDKDELDTLVTIAHALRPVVDGERAKAQAELAAMAEVALRPKWKRWAIGASVLVLCGLAYQAYTEVQARRAATRRYEVDKEGGTGCPCGCDRSEAMAAELREQGGPAAPETIEKTLTTIAEREAVGYVTERMIEHRLRMHDLALELGRPELRRGGTTSARCSGTPSESETLRVCGDLVVHGERTERVDGRPKLITSSYRLWLEIENRTSHELHLVTPSIEGGRFHFPVSRWYEEGGAGAAWDGVLAPRERRRVNVIGYVPEVVAPGAEIRVVIALGAATMVLETRALADIHLARLDAVGVTP